MPEAEEGLVDKGETLYKFTAEGRDIEVNTGGSCFFQLRVDGTGDDVTGGERASFVVFVDELGALIVDEDSPFPTHGFGD